MNQAIICYKKAIEADVKCAKYHWQRCSLLEQVSEKTKALLGYKRLLNVLDPDQASMNKLDTTGSLISLEWPIEGKVCSLQRSIASNESCLGWV